MSSLPSFPQRHGYELDPPCDEKSIAAAKQAQQLERLRVYLETGVRIDDEGHFVFADFPIDPMAQWALGVSAAVAALKR